jgi:hypothetical protein
MNICDYSGLLGCDVMWLLYELMFWRNVSLVTANVPSLLIISALMMEVTYFSETSVLQEPQGITSQKTAFFIVAAVKTSNLT